MTRMLRLSLSGQCRGPGRALLARVSSDGVGRAGPGQGRRSADTVRYPRMGWAGPDNGLVSADSESPADSDGVGRQAGPDS